MPSKSVEERIRRARAEGTTATIKATDPGVRGPKEELSSHAAKKSRWVVGEGHPTGRTTSHHNPPHMGRMTSPPAEGEAERAVPSDWRAALPREERYAERLRMGRPEKISPGTKKRGQF